MEHQRINDLLRLLAAGKQNEVLQFVVSLLENSNDLELLSTAAHYLQNANLLDSAKQLTDKVLKLKPDFIPSLVTQGSIARAENNFALANSCYQQAIALDDKCISAHYNMGVLSERQGLYHAAIVHYNNILSIEEKHIKSRLRIGICLQKLGDLKQALMKFQELDLISPDSATIKYHLGLTLQQDRQIEAAAESFATVLLIAADHIEAQHALATIHSEQQQYELAISGFLQVLKLDPGHNEALHNLASIYYHNNNYKKALDAWLKLLSHKPDKFTNYNIGSCYLALNKHDEALPYLEAACEDLPESTDPIINLASVYIKAANWNKVVQLYEQALAINPASYEIKYVLSAILQTENTFIKAPKEYITHLFDHYAENFEAHLLDNLAYKAHIVIADALQQQIVPNQRYSILDLGCGTGLCGKVCAKYASKLIGVDLSSKMLAKAKKLEVYDELYQAEIEEFLERENVFEIVIAADVMPYIGDISITLELIHKRLSSAGLVVFTLEKTETDSLYSLSESGRYQHNTAVLKSHLRDKWEIIKVEDTTTRTQNFQPVKSTLFVLKKPLEKDVI